VKVFKDEKEGKTLSEKEKNSQKVGKGRENRESPGFRGKSKKSRQKAERKGKPVKKEGVTVSSRLKEKSEHTRDKRGWSRAA